MIEQKVFFAGLFTTSSFCGEGLNFCLKMRFFLVKYQGMYNTRAVNLTLLCINSEAVIPTPYQVRGKLQRESSPKNTGFRVKPGMTNKAKTFLNHYANGF